MSLSVLALLVALLTLYGIVAFIDHWFETVRIFIPNPVHPSHLRDVEAEMRTLGPPVLRMLKHGEDWYSVEGSHRCTAAARLGCGVRIVPLDPAELIEGDDLLSPTMEPISPFPAEDLPWIFKHPRSVRIRKRLIRMEG